VASMEAFSPILERLKHNLDLCIHGKQTEIELMLTALLAGGHVLVEDVPGTGKTVLIKALAKSIHADFRRIQCNPDLLPTDITGVSIYHPKEETFLFRKGPIFTNIMLVDEINRTTTKTQSALLEAMEERHVTVDGESHDLPYPFLLLATQNPIDFEGTYSLPEAQLDRFMIKLSLGYPDEKTEKRMIASQLTSHPLDALVPVCEASDIVAMQNAVKGIHIDESVSNYLTSIIRATREHPAIFLGASPRATLALVAASRAFALLQGREFVLPDDVKYLVPFVLKHRMILHNGARMEGTSLSSVLQTILDQARVPVRMEK